MVLGAVTGVGGSCIHDPLMNRSPGVLHTDIHAVAGICGATVMVLGGATCFTLRLVAI